MRSVIVYAPSVSARLSYVLDWLLTGRLKLRYTIVDDIADVEPGTFYISYGLLLPGALSIPAAGLLAESGVIVQTIETGEWLEIPTLFATSQKGFTLPFDMLSAIFFLLSRYEEYYPYQKDKHGRYPATDSVLYKYGWLRRPLVDEWLQLFRHILHRYIEIDLPDATCTFVPTYDIDIAYSYLGKGILRNTGGLLKDLMSGNTAACKERILVLTKKKDDPYYCFPVLLALHLKYGLTPLFFILSALRNGPYDKNLLPGNKEMKDLVRLMHKYGGEVFIHPSYNAQNAAVIAQEKKALEKNTGTTITSSRQHYIRNFIPQTYRVLQQQGIVNDYSMGYATHIGFRAGTGFSFPWYDLEAEYMTPLQIYPFCFMDTAARYEEGMTVGEAFSELQQMARIQQQNNGCITTVFHNFSLGTDPGWQGWMEAYLYFMEDME